MGALPTQNVRSRRRREKGRVDGRGGGGLPTYFRLVIGSSTAHPLTTTTRAMCVGAWRGPMRSRVCFNRMHSRSLCTKITFPSGGPTTLPGNQTGRQTQQRSAAAVFVQTTIRDLKELPPCDSLCDTCSCGFIAAAFLKAELSGATVSAVKLHIACLAASCPPPPLPPPKS